MSFIKKIWKDPVGSGLLVVVLSSIGVSLLPSVRAWIFAGLGNIARVQVIAWFLVGAVVGAGVCWLRLRKQGSRPIEKADPVTEHSAIQVRAASEEKAFLPLTIEDKKLDLEWHLKIKPSEWIGDHRLPQHSPSYHETILAGPYHGVEGCRAQLATSYRHGDAPILEGKCPGCDLPIFRSPEYVSLWKVREQALAELQRMSRNGRLIEGKVILEKPEYWKKMSRATAPPSAPNPRG
jgi:hypothetical protein